MTNPTSWIGLLALVVHVVDRLVGQALDRRIPVPQPAQAVEPPTTLAQVERWAAAHGLVDGERE